MLSAKSDLFTALSMAIERKSSDKCAEPNTSDLNITDWIWYLQATSANKSRASLLCDESPAICTSLPAAKCRLTLTIDGGKWKKAASGETNNQIPKTFIAYVNRMNVANSFLLPIKSDVKGTSSTLHYHFRRMTLQHHSRRMERRAAINLYIERQSWTPCKR